MWLAQKKVIFERKKGLLKISANMKLWPVVALDKMLFSVQKY